MRERVQLVEREGHRQAERQLRQLWIETATGLEPLFLKHGELEMTAKSTGGDAFPNPGSTDWGVHPTPGMTLRDYFAGEALPALLTQTYEMLSQTGRQADSVYEIAAEAAYEAADAMLEVRGRG
jgi:hypothetical protein